METPPIITKPPILPPGKKPFAIQAAQASMWAPLVAVGVSFAVNAGMANQLTPAAKIITGSVCTLLIVFGFALGVIALFGVRCHGSKGILGRAIAGVCINGILIAVIVTTIVSFMNSSARTRIDQQQKSDELKTHP